MDNLYFGHDNIITVNVLYFGEKSLLTRLRKLGDKYNQYVVANRYLDYLSFYEDKYKYYYFNSFNSDKLNFEHILNYKCDNCNTFIKNVKNNKIVSIHIYPKGVYPDLYINRKNKWNKFKNEIFDKINKINYNYM